jgi:hypothetical protein
MLHKEFLRPIEEANHGPASNLLDKRIKRADEDKTLSAITDMVREAPMG